MRGITGILCLLIMLMSAPSFAQISTASKSKKAQQQDPQRELDEQLASKCFQNQEYEKAKELYHQLFKKKGATQHFNQYVECLLRLGEFNTAEEELKRFIRSNPSYGKSKIDLVYVYTNNGKQDKADEMLREILKGLPDNKNSILNIQNMFRSRMLYNAALAVLS